MSAATDARTGASFGADRLAGETRERFVREILARVPLERVVEVHFFPPIRQGGVETGVAVVAAMPAPAPEVAPPPEPAPEPAAPPVGRRGRRVVAKEPTAAATIAVEPAQAAPDAEPAPEPAAQVEPVEQAADEACDPTDDAAGPVPTNEAEPVAPAPQPEQSEAPGASAEAAADPADVTGESSVAASGTDEPAEPLPEASMQEVLDEDVPVDVEAEPAPRDAWPRHTIFAARYRLTLKGPDRGRWDVDVVEEADAPLVTVEAVVRGVQRRSGDAGDAERLTNADVAAMAARAPAPTVPGAARPPR